jgi:hypothetical protein
MLSATPSWLPAQASPQLRKCDKPIGTLAVNEPERQYMTVFARYSLGSPSALLRTMAQNSKCFLVVERGAGMQNMQQERALARAGEMQQDANMGGGQMKAADFVLSATVQVMDNNAGGVGAVAGALLGRGAALLAGGLRFKEAQTSILISDARTTVQVAAADGKARRNDFSLGALGVAGALVGVGGYSSTAEGKVIAASYLDNFNNIVDQLKADATMVARAERFMPTGLTGDEVRAGARFLEGDLLSPKIDNVRLLDAPADTAGVAATLRKGTELVYLGEEKDGFVKVQGSEAEGWVKKSLVARR